MTTASPALDYTPTDWKQWDGFNLDSFSFVKRTAHGLQDTPLTVTGATATPAATYFTMFKQEAIVNFYENQRLGFTRLQTAPGSYDDYIFQYQQNAIFEVQKIVNKVNYALNQAYNTYRTAKREGIRYEAKLELATASKGVLPVDATVLLDDQARLAFSALPIDFKGLAGTADILQWLTSLLTLHLDNQCLDPNFVVKREDPNDWRGPTWKPYGVWRNPVTKVYDQQNHWWQAGEIGYLYGHYLHLLDTALIRRIRKSALGSLSALWTIFELERAAGGGGDGNMAITSNIESQWMLRVDGWVLNTYVLQRSQAELVKRGVWDQAVDDTLYETINTFSPNLSAGQWSAQAVLTQAETMVAQMYGRWSTIGLSEFLSVYSNYHQNILAGWLMHCPASQAIYDQCSAMWKIVLRQLAVNFHPASASFPGASGRSHDLFSGYHNSIDTLDQPLYFEHVLKAGAKPKSVLRVLTGKTPVVANLALPGSAYYFDPKYTDLTQYYRRNAYTLAQLGGEGYLPFIDSQTYIANAPLHINEDRFSLVTGQERYNFLSPQVAMGHSGENSYLLGGSITLAVRMGGEKPPPAKGPFAGSANRRSPFSSYIRLMTETAGNPFQTEQKLARSVVCQYQGFMLVTHLFAPTATTTAAELATAPWHSNLCLPLAVDSLLTNKGIVLPSVIGTDLELALDDLCFTVRHGNGAVVVRLVSADFAGVASVRWRVTAESVANGCGLVVVRHRQVNEVASQVRPFKVCWLFGSGKYTNQVELANLRTLIFNAKVTQELTVVAGVWEDGNQPTTSYPVGSPAAAGLGEVGSRRWLTTAVVGALKLAVDRTDSYLPWGNHPVYAQPRKGPLNVAPYYVKVMKRLVNDQETMVWGVGQGPSRSLIVKDSEVYAPHRGQSVVMVRGGGLETDGWTYG